MKQKRLKMSVNRCFIRVRAASPHLITFSKFFLFLTEEIKCLRSCILNNCCLILAEFRPPKSFCLVARNFNCTDRQQSNFYKS